MIKMSAKLLLAAGAMISVLDIEVASFQHIPVSHNRPISSRLTETKMLVENIDSLVSIHTASPSGLAEAIPHWLQYASQGIADAAVATKPVCPGFGEPGWAPFCFLQGNPVFQAFDSFQAFIQNSVVQLHDLLYSLGIENAYGPSIVLFTVFVRMFLFPLNFQQLESTTKTQLLSPKIEEIKTKYPDNKELQNQMVALLYQETKVNPLAGCLPALFQLPVFVALYRSFYNLASQGTRLKEPFLWLPNLDGPVYGTRSQDWLLNGWHDMTPSLGWHDTLCYLSIPVILMIAQSVSLRVLTPPSDDPTVQQSQRILKYLPLMIGYFSLSVPAGLGVYWITNNILSTLSTFSIKQYLKLNPPPLTSVDLDSLANNQNSVYMNPAWGYTSREQMMEEARLNYRPPRKPKIPSDFTY